MNKYDKGYQSHYREINRGNRRANNRKRYYSLKEQGLCTQCGKENDSEYTTCTQCRCRRNGYKREWASTKRGKEKQLGYDATRRNTTERKEYQRDYKRGRYNRDIKYKLSRLITDRLSKAMSGRVKTGRALDYLGCSLDELKQHLECQFETGMNWDNYGEWHIDHIIPLASFDLSKDDDLAKVCHYTNLRPLWARDNLRKWAKIL